MGCSTANNNIIIYAMANYDNIRLPHLTFKLKIPSSIPGGTGIKYLSGVRSKRGIDTSPH